MILPKWLPSFVLFFFSHSLIKGSRNNEVAQCYNERFSWFGDQTPTQKHSRTICCVCARVWVCLFIYFFKVATRVQADGCLEMRGRGRLGNTERRGLWGRCGGQCCWQEVSMKEGRSQSRAHDLSGSFLFGSSKTVWHRCSGLCFVAGRFYYFLPAVLRPFLTWKGWDDSTLKDKTG